MTHSKGYITLLSVLVVGAVGVALTTSVILLGLGSIRSSFAYQQSLQARSFASACAEEGLERIRIASSFTGSATLTFAGGSCTYTVTTQGTENRTVNATGTVGTIVRKVRVIITAINPLIVVSSWQDVP